MPHWRVQYSTVGEKRWIPKGRSTGQLVGYVEKGADKESLRKDFISDFEDIVGTKNIEIVEDRIWEYNIRYSSSQIEAGLPGQINKAQGEGNVWYTGGALSRLMLNRF